MKAKPLPSLEYLRECFSYDHDVGLLVWRRRPQGHFATKSAWQAWTVRHADKPAGYVNHLGYRQVRLNGPLYGAHRIIWKLIAGEEPSPTLDHKDVDPGNNRWGNLRPATQTQQNFNQRLRRDNTLGRRGIAPNGDRWWAKIMMNGFVYYLGSYDTPEEASAAYEGAARVLQGEFYRSPTKTNPDKAAP